ncbi:MAG: CapA family protein [Clostridia bacterium]|nr:CapA family protein [Clostridia bacterium]
MKFTAAGDAIIQRRMQQDFVGISEIAPFIMQGDARFFNLETTLNREGECFASQFSGGTWIRTNPQCLSDSVAFGFNMTNVNNNHALDFSYEGFYRTMEAVNESGMVHAGVGYNLDEASVPRYLDTKNGRVALISVCSTFEPCMMAGKQARRVKGRPGVNGLRLRRVVHVEEQDIAMIRELAKKCRVNAEIEIDRAAGYFPPLPENEAEFGSMRFAVGEPGLHLFVYEEDLDRVKKAIYEAKLQADYIMISLHSHEIDGANHEEIPAFLREFAHDCIDAGAHTVVGHGPHLLRPIEVYRDRPIFYSLGDFILQLYNVELAPEDFYNSWGLTSDATVHELLKTRSADFTRGLMEKRCMALTVVPYWETDADGKLIKLQLLPIELDMTGHHADRGLPRKATDLAWFKDYFGNMCAPYDIRFTIREDDVIDCAW